jgi:predicted DNA-binding transcriptional regulator AlpA
MEAQVAKTESPVPALLADVALIDARTAAAGGCMGVSWWHAKVATGEAPQPAIRGVRCTRWRLADVRTFWAEFAERADAEAAAKVTAMAKRGSAAASAKRNAEAAPA